MEKVEDTKKLAESYMEKAEEKLRSAKLLLKEKFIDDAISRAYYAAFLSAKALLLLLGSDTRTHSGVLTMFSLKVIREGILPREIGKYLNELFDARQASDYSPIALYDEEDAREFINKAEKIYLSIKVLLEEKFFK
ncbi:MAG: HEPN domain-containing protein [Candidatus Asgardarchaeia archaeon]